MIDLAIYAVSEHVSLSSVSERQDISENYLERLFLLLERLA
jgi:DNA-binding IscR family transcriptional regulator